MIRITLILILIFCFCHTSQAEELLQVPVAIHIASKVSDGKYSIPEITAIARKNDIKVVVITDRDSMRWEYGLWPLRNIIKDTVQEGSIFNYGVRRYLKDIKDTQAANPDMVLIAGVESAPFYYWKGSVFKNDLKICDWHKHLLVIGLDKPEDYDNIPIIGNVNGLRQPIKFKNIFYLLLELIVIFSGMRILAINKTHSPKLKIAGVVMIISGLLFLRNSYPFCDLKFDQYSGEQKIMPYQNLIDYANRRAALTFWAHPEAEYVQSTSRVGIETYASPQDLLKAQDYTGFAVFYEGYRIVGCVGGIWDNILREYCAGKRKSPIWAIGGLSFDSTGELEGYLKDVRTMLLVSRLDKNAVMDSLKSGRMYVMRGKSSSMFRLDKFIVRDTLKNISKTMGENLDTGGKPLTEISGHFLNGQSEPLKIKLIRGGKVIREFEAGSPFSIFYQDDSGGSSKKDYYRLEISSPTLMLVSNPVFITQKDN